MQRVLRVQVAKATQTGCAFTRIEFLNRSSRSPVRRVFFESENLAVGGVTLFCTCLTFGFDLDIDLTVFVLLFKHDLIQIQTELGLNSTPLSLVRIHFIL